MRLRTLRKKQANMNGFPTVHVSTKKPHFAHDPYTGEKLRNWAPRMRMSSWIVAWKI